MSQADTSIITHWVGDLNIPFPNEIPPMSSTGKLHMGGTYPYFGRVWFKPHGEPLKMLPLSVCGAGRPHLTRAQTWPTQCHSVAVGPTGSALAWVNLTSVAFFWKHPQQQHRPPCITASHFHPVSQGTEAPERWKDLASGPLHCVKRKPQAQNGIT